MDDTIQNKTQLDKLNEFLIKLGSAERIGVRRKLVILNKGISNILDIKTK